MPTLTEMFEYADEIFFGDANTCVADAESHISIGLDARECRNCAARRREFHCICQQIEQDLLELGGDARYPRIGVVVLLHDDAAAFEASVQDFERGLDQVGDGDLLMARSVGAGQAGTKSHGGHDGFSLQKR